MLLSHMQGGIEGVAAPRSITHSRNVSAAVNDSSEENIRAGRFFRSSLEKRGATPSSSTHPANIKSLHLILGTYKWKDLGY